MADKEFDKDKKAVALKYERQKEPAPKVIAKGKGLIAEQIIRVAEEHDIKIKEDAALVDILHTLEIDSLIPLEAYAAVAEILSYVYRTNAAMAGKRLGDKV